MMPTNPSPSNPPANNANPTEEKKLEEKKAEPQIIPEKKENAEEEKKDEILTEEIRANIDAIFNLFDKSKEGAILFTDLPVIMRALNQNPTPKELEEIKTQFDPKSTNKISKKDLEIIMENRLRDPDTFEELLEAFKIFDEDKDNKLSNQELKYAMTTLGEKMKEEDVDEMIKEADTDNDGYIDIVDFSKLLMSVK